MLSHGATQARAGPTFFGYIFLSFAYLLYMPQPAVRVMCADRNLNLHLLVCGMTLGLTELLRTARDAYSIVKNRVEVSQVWVNRRVLKERIVVNSVHLRSKEGKMPIVGTLERF